MAATASPLTMVLGQVYDVELSGTPGTKTVIVAPANARFLVLKSVSVDSKLFAPVAGGTDFETLAADSLRTIRVPGSGSGRTRNLDTAAAASNTRRVELSSLTASAIVQCKAVEA